MLVKGPTMLVKGSATGRMGDVSPQYFNFFNIMPMGDAWKEWTSNGLRLPNHRVMTEPLVLVTVGLSSLSPKLSRD